MLVAAVPRGAPHPVIAALELAKAACDPVGSGERWFVHPRNGGLPARARAPTAAVVRRMRAMDLTRMEPS